MFDYVRQSKEIILTEKFGFNFVWLPNIIELKCSIVLDFVRLHSITEHLIAYLGLYKGGLVRNWNL